jgi:hypothetical protein
MNQLDLFRELPEMPKPAPPEIISPKHDMSADADREYRIGVTVLEIPDPARCAQILIEEFPDATKEELLAVIAECEPIVIRWGCPDLSILRAELERAHPAWVASG